MKFLIVFVSVLLGIYSFLYIDSLDDSVVTRKEYNKLEKRVDILEARIIKMENKQ